MCLWLAHRLDIYGFEILGLNGFDQLCINFTNEKLQAHFMDALVKLRVLEYEAEGVSCDQIDFPDNEAQLKLIDGVGPTMRMLPLPWPAP